MATTDEEAFDLFIAQVDYNLSTADTTDLAAAVTGGDVAAVLTVVRAMAADACGKAKLLRLGSPVGTILRNTVSGLTVERKINDKGLTVWRGLDDTGSRIEYHDIVLLPEADWKCIYNPAAT